MTIGPATSRNQTTAGIAAAVVAALAISGGTNPSTVKATSEPAPRKSTGHSRPASGHVRVMGGVTMASRSNKPRPTLTKTKKPETKPNYPDNLDGWIREARAVMAEHDIPGSYNAIKAKIMDESSGDPNAVNDWDVNAQNGTPSKGLMQVIQPTFDEYHVKGTKDRLTDPVANIVAGCNYAKGRYGSIDNVDPNSGY